MPSERGIAGAAVGFSIEDNNEVAQLRPESSAVVKFAPTPRNPPTDQVAKWWEGQVETGLESRPAWSLSGVGSGSIKLLRERAVDVPADDDSIGQDTDSTGDGGGVEEASGAGVSRAPGDLDWG
jgi:hypothetical protein